MESSSWTRGEAPTGYITKKPSGVATWAAGPIMTSIRTVYTKETNNKRVSVLSMDLCFSMR